MTSFEKALEKFNPDGEDDKDAVISMTLRNYNLFAEFMWNAALDAAQDLEYDSHGESMWSDKVIRSSDIEKLKVSQNEI